MASIRKLDNGRWQAQFRPVPGGRQYTKTTQRKADAQRWLDEQTATVMTGQFVDPKAGKITFGQYYRQWSARQVWQSSTRAGMDSQARAVPFWDLPLKSLNRAHFELWIKSMESPREFDNNHAKRKLTGLAPQTIIFRYKQVQGVLRGAVRDKVIIADPAAGVRLPRSARPNERSIPTVEQVRELLKFAPPDFKAFIGLSAFAGLRRGEAMAVKVGDIDPGRGTLKVSRQLQELKSRQFEIRAPKYGSTRTIFLAGVLEDMLVNHLAALPRSSDPETWLFQWNGKNLSAAQVAYKWKCCKSLAKVAGVRLHDLRHFFASSLIVSGCDVVTVQHALGHANASITLGTYAHVWPKAEDRTRAALDAALADVF